MEIEYEPTCKEVTDQITETMSYDLKNLMDSITKLEWIVLQLEEKVKQHSRIINNLKDFQSE